MKRGSKTLGITLLLLGGLMILGMLGMNVGWLVGIAIPAFMIYKGYQIFTKQEAGKFKKGFGVALMLIGILWLTNMLHFIIGITLAAVLIYFGIKMIKSGKPLTASSDVAYEANISPTYSHTLDEIDQWENKLNQNNGGN